MPFQTEIEPSKGVGLVGEGIIGSSDVCVFQSKGKGFPESVGQACQYTKTVSKMVGGIAVEFVYQYKRRFTDLFESDNFAVIGMIQQVVGGPHFNCNTVIRMETEQKRNAPVSKKVFAVKIVPLVPVVDVEERKPAGQSKCFVDFVLGQYTGTPANAWSCKFQGGVHSNGEYVKPDVPGMIQCFKGRAFVVL